MSAVTLKPQTNFYAAVDLGSNSFHLLLVEATEGGVRIRSRVKQKVRLASGLNDHHELDQASMERGWNCLTIFAQQLQSIPPKNIVVVATATLRLATNCDEFVARGNAILGTPINVISGEEEARLIFKGVTNDKKHNLSSLVIDIGGASTEIAYGIGTQASELNSINVGCVTWMKTWFPGNQLNAKCFNNAVIAAKDAIAPLLPKLSGLIPDDCLGASGTPQAIIEILNSQNRTPIITLPFLKQLAHECCNAWHLDNLNIKGLEPSRRAIFPAGLAILIAIFESLKIADMHLAQGALREGVLSELLPAAINRDQEKIFDLFKVDKNQAHRVYRCCQQLLANCTPELNLTEQQRKVLENACFLHEVGQSISFKNHQQHSRYLITNTNMAWLNFEEKDMIARIVSSNPGKSAPQSNQYADGQDKVTALIRILRLATILCAQRNDERFITPEVTVNEHVWRLGFRENYLSENPLLEHLLNEEKGLIKGVNWILDFT